VKPPKETSPARASFLQLKNQPWTIAILAAISVTGGLFIWYGTFWGPWAFSDGVGYIVNARNLLLGRGLGIYRASGDFILLVTHPPLYPWLLAGLGKLGMGLVTAARWIDVALFGGFLFFSGWLFHRLTRSAWLAIGLTVVLLVHPALLLAYLSAMSEPLFLVCIMSSLLLLAIHLVHGDRASFIAAAFAAGGALMTRYPGAALIGACLAAILVFPNGARRKRLTDGLTFLAISVTPTLGFVVWTRFVLNSRSPRAFKTSPDVLRLVKSFTRQVFDSIQTWKPVPPDVIPNLAIPGSVFRPLLGILGVILFGLFVWSLAKIYRGRARVLAETRPPFEWRPIGVFALFLAAYLGFFLAAYVITFPTPDVDARTLLPMLPVGLLLAVAIVDLIRHQMPDTRLFDGVLIVTVAVSVLGWSLISRDTVLGLHRTGLGYTSRAWRQSDTLHAVERLSPDITLVSNETAAILLYTDRSAYEIPGLKAGDSQPLSIPFGSGSSDLDRAYRNGQVALVLFDTMKGQLESGPATTQGLVPGDLTTGLNRIFKGNDGAIYCQCSLASRLPRLGMWISAPP
jgi:4-amino-4-deoxy-L-arabinose transferase-like glycosyltransferase